MYIISSYFLCNYGMAGSSILFKTGKDDDIVVDKKYLPKRILELFDKEPVKLAPWDPMGALAL